VSHHFIVPTNENGVSLDARIGQDINLAMSRPFGFNHIFLYSHGWWTDAVRALEGYNRFTIEFSAQFRSNPGLAGLPTLSVGIHWPSTLSEDQFSLLNYVQAASFFTMEKRADTVGENCGQALLKFVLNAPRAGGEPLRIHLLGHSFGCKVVCAALEQIAEDSATDPIPDGVLFDAVLLQAALDNDELEAQKDYARLADGIPGLRLLVSRSDADSALGTLYPMAHQLAHLFHRVQPALGFAGPTAATAGRFGGASSVDVGPGFDAAAGDLQAGRLVVADLTALHNANPDNADPYAGHHSDIFLPEIYKLLQAFLFPRPAP
jgi:hypothetical protein